jgi:two-component system nitrate/nitrite response regulator NarL
MIRQRAKAAEIQNGLMEAAVVETAVVIVEDSEVALRQLKSAVTEVPGLKVAGAAPTPGEAIHLVSSIRPAITILDVFLKGGTGIDVLHAIREQGIPTHVVVVTNAPSEMLNEACRGLGARFFFDKALEFEDFQEALRTLRAEAV